MFETVESYNAEKEYKRKMEAESMNRRQSDWPTPKCIEQSAKINSIEDKMEQVAETMTAISKSMENIAKGISNTVDSHRAEINSLNTRVKDVEHMAKEAKAQRAVLLVVFASVSVVIFTIFFDYYTFKAKTLESNTHFEKLVKEYHGTKNK